MERRFSEKQVGEIMRRAAEKIGEKDVPDEGVSESELLRITGELGLDQKTLLSAIDEVVLGAAEDSGDFSTLHRDLERVIEREISEDELGAVFQEFTPSSEFGGAPTRLGDTFNYKSSVGAGYCDISVSNKEDRTTVRMQTNGFAYRYPLYAMIGVSTLMFLAVGPKKIDAVPLNAIVAFGGPTLMIGLAHLFIKRSVKSTNERIMEKLNRVVNRLRRTSYSPLRESLAEPGAEAEPAEVQQTSS